MKVLRLTSNPYNSTQNGFLSFPAAYRSSGSEKSTNNKKQKKTLKVMKNKKENKIIIIIIKSIKVSIMNMFISNMMS